MAATQGVTDTDHAAAFRQAVVSIVLAAAVGLASASLSSLAGLTSEALGQTVTDHVSDLIHAKEMRQTGPSHRSLSTHFRR